MAKKQKSIYKLYKTQNNEYCSAVKIMQVRSGIPLTSGGYSNKST